MRSKQRGDEIVLTSRKAFLLAVLALAVVAGARAEETKLYDVVLLSFSGSKILAIKAVREVSWMGIKDAKDLVEGAPKTVREGVTKEEGDAAIKALEAVQCKVELRPSQVKTVERHELVLKSFEQANKGQIAAIIQGAAGVSEDGAKKLLETLPATIKQGLLKIEAERLKTSFESASAKVEIKDSSK